MLEKLDENALVLNDFLENQSLALVLRLKNKSEIPLTPTLSAYIDGEQVFWDWSILRAAETSSFLADLPDSHGEHDIVFYIGDKKLCEVRYSL